MNDNLLYRYCVQFIGKQHDQRIRKSYYRWFLASSIGYRSERSIKVVEVHFTLCLKLVEEVEEMECENSAGANQSCRKPTGVEKLIMTGSRFYPRVVTETVHDSHCVNT